MAIKNIEGAERFIVITFEDHERYDFKNVTVSSFSDDINAALSLINHAISAGMPDEFLDDVIENFDRIVGR